MKNKEKYFTPTIEDFYFGYEFEYQAPDKKWHKVTYHINDTEKLNFVYINPKKLQELIGKEQVRVPYLTKEQIKNKLKHDWSFNKSSSIFKKKIIKENFTLYINLYYNKFFKKLQVKVIEEYEEFNKLKRIKYNLFNGKCKDINTFRKIIKLLNIN